MDIDQEELESIKSDDVNIVEVDIENCELTEWEDRTGIASTVPGIFLPERADLGLRYNKKLLVVMGDSIVLYTQWKPEADALRDLTKRELNSLRSRWEDSFSTS